MYICVCDVCNGGASCIAVDGDAVADGSKTNACKRMGGMQAGRAMEGRGGIGGTE